MAETTVVSHDEGEEDNNCVENVSGACNGCMCPSTSSNPLVYIVYAFHTTIIFMIGWIAVTAFLLINHGPDTDTRHETWAIIVNFIVSYAMYCIVLIKTIMVANVILMDIRRANTKRISVLVIVDLFFAFAIASGAILMTFWLIDPGLPDRTYYIEARGDFEDDLWLVWLQFMSFGMSLTSIGYGSYIPVNVWSQWVSSIINLCQLLLFALVGVLIADIIAKGYNNRAIKRHKQEEKDIEAPIPFDNAQELDYLVVEGQ